MESQMLNFNHDQQGKESNVTPFIYSSDIKLIVFDLHGTITNRTSIHPYHINYRNRYIERKLGHSIPEDLHVSTDEAFAMFPMLDKYEFYQYRDNDPLFDFGRIHTPNPELISKLKAISESFHTVLYTDSSMNQINRTLLVINLIGIFKPIIGRENGQRKVAGQVAVYQNLCRLFGVKMKNILMVGDRMDKDINPVLMSGGNAIRIESNKYMVEALDLIIRKFANKDHTSKRQLYESPDYE